ncbi:MAG: iron ABC transporter permease [Thermodesulfobacteriota bacterium]|nr:iron ABC transporter permease [Thermodesulfobacteriota bacterium]
MTKVQNNIMAAGTSIRYRILTENLILLAILAVLIIGAAGLGYMHIAMGDVCRIVIGTWFNMPEMLSSIADNAAAVVIDVRLPRIMAAVVVGSGLALSGAVYQGVLLNPLADPFTLGISAGAAFGASVALLFFPSTAFYVLPVAAFIGATLTLFAVIFLATGRTFSRDGVSAGSLILSGIIVSAILSAGISFLKYLADEQVSIIIFWLMGSFAAKTWLEVGIAAVVVITGFLVIYYFSRDLNVISLGDRMAASLGVDTKKTILCLLLTASCVAAVCVAISGIIGFVGLLVPHMMRSWTGPDNRRLLPVCVLAGAILMLSADTVTRAVLPAEIPIGVLTALIGGPVFCWIFRKNRIEGRV